MEINVNLNVNPYKILIKKSYSNIQLPVLKGQKVLIVTDSNVSKYYLKDLLNNLKTDYKVSHIILKAGEKSKTLNNVILLYKKCLEDGLDRESLVIALGGGVIGDLSGFVASTYLRGIPFVTIPTTLLAQVDASIGGKTGVDLTQGKNLVGTFYQPRLVFIDVNTLLTLNDREFINGFAEVIKYGIIKDKSFFKYLSDNKDAIILKETKALEKIVSICASIKRDVVVKDERELALRKILNFGHTLGHSIETINSYKKIKHGEAISIGMVFAAYLAKNLGLCKASVLHEIIDILKIFKLPVALNKDWNVHALIKVMSYDKKMKQGRINFVLPIDIGIVIVKELELHVVLDVLKKFKKEKF